VAMGHRSPPPQYTPPKTNMEPENHQFEEENHLPKLQFLGSMLVFGGVIGESMSFFFKSGVVYIGSCMRLTVI